MARQTSKKTVRKAKALRRDMSLPEVLLWQELRQSEIKFRRQHPVGPYVADFYCAAAKVIIEVDGIAHDMGDRPEKDVRRDQFLNSRGLSVLRIAATEVLDDANAVALSIANYCREKLK